MSALFAAAIVCVALSGVVKRARWIRPLGYLFVMVIFVVNEANAIIEHRSWYLIAFGVLCIYSFGSLMWRSYAARQVSGPT